MKIIIAAAAAASALALAGTASAQVYGTIGYSYYDTQTINLGGPTARIGWKSPTPLGLELEGSIGTDKDTTGKIGPDVVRVQLQNQWAGYVTATGKIGDSFEAFARVGYGSTSLKASSTATSLTTTPFTFHDTFDSWNMGVGGQFVYDGVNGIRFEYTRMHFTDDGIDDSNTYTISYVRKFGMPAK
ncbi:MAG TPA: outer membrane beta-barrel protein [Caulobacteraceae bacterium]|nr:outer membrane beta-barrel protein [Caulobacteraceae bacterium]